MTEALSRPVLSEAQTWEQICERYPDQWVVLVDMIRPDEDRDTRFRTARVAGAGKSRREALDQARPLRSAYPSFASRYTGEIQAPPVRAFIPEPAFVVDSLASFWPPSGDDERDRASTAEPAVSEPLTWDEICKRYPEQWVVLVAMDWSGKGFQFRTARVAGHGKTRAEPLEQARPLRFRYSSFCNFFTGSAAGPAPSLSL
jgi:hypothetical protein